MQFINVLRSEGQSLCSWRSPFFYILILVPLVYTWLFGFIYEENAVNNIPLAIYDEDNTTISRAIGEAYNTSDKFSLNYYASSLTDFENALRRDDIKGGIYIPPNFSRDLKLSHGSNLGIVVDATNIVYGNGSLPAHYEIGTALNVKTANNMLQGLQVPPPTSMSWAYPVRLQTRILGNPTNSYSYFMLFGLIANALQIGIFLASASLLCQDYKKQLLASCNFYAIALVRFTYTFIASCLVGGISFAIGSLYFGVPMLAPISQPILLTMSFLFMFIAICFFISAISPNELIALQLPLVYIMPGLLYSGLSWPQEWMDTGAKIFSALMPLTYYGNTLRDLSLKGFSLTFTENIVIMLVSGSILLTLSLFIFNYKCRRIARS